MQRFLTAVTVVLLCCGCYDRFSDPQQTLNDHQTNTTIAELQSLWFGHAAVVDEDIVIGGRVTSSDKAGNFYRTFTIADATGGVEILAGPTDLHNIYPIGCRVSIHLQGCAIDSSNAILQIGLPAEEYDYNTLEYFQSRVNLDKHIVRDSSTEELRIPTLKYAELSRSLCGMPVTLEALHCTSTPNDSGTWEGYVRFEDEDGNAIYTTTSSYADFAGEAVPDGTVSLTGIAGFGTVSREVGQQYIIKMRSIEDCRHHN